MSNFFPLAFFSLCLKKVLEILALSFFKPKCLTELCLGTGRKGANTITDQILCLKYCARDTIFLFNPRFFVFVSLIQCQDSSLNTDEKTKALKG